MPLKNQEKLFLDNLINYYSILYSIIENIYDYYTKNFQKSLKSFKKIKTKTMKKTKQTKQTETNNIQMQNITESEKEKEKEMAKTIFDNIKVKIIDLNNLYNYSFISPTVKSSENNKFAEYEKKIYDLYSKMFDDMKTLLCLDNLINYYSILYSIIENIYDYYTKNFQKSLKSLKKKQTKKTNIKLSNFTESKNIKSVLNNINWKIVNLNNSKDIKPEEEKREFITYEKEISDLYLKMTKDMKSSLFIGEQNPVYINNNNNLTRTKQLTNLSSISNSNLSHGYIEINGILSKPSINTKIYSGEFPELTIYNNQFGGYKKTRKSNKYSHSK
jgi:hypothetical protein